MEKKQQLTFEDKIKTNDEDPKNEDLDKKIKKDDLPPVADTNAPIERVVEAAKKESARNSDTTDVTIDKVVIPIPIPSASNFSNTMASQTITPANTILPLVTNQYTSNYKFDQWEGKSNSSKPVSVYDEFTYGTLDRPGDVKYKDADAILLLHNSRNSSGAYSFLSNIPQINKDVDVRKGNPKCPSIWKLDYIQDLLSLMHEYILNYDMIVQNRDAKGLVYGEGKIDSDDGNSLGWLWKHIPFNTELFWNTMSLRLRDIKQAVGTYNSNTIMGGRVKVSEQHYTPILSLEGNRYELFRQEFINNRIVPTMDIYNYITNFRLSDETVVRENWRTGLDFSTKARRPFFYMYRYLVTLSLHFREFIHEPLLSAAIDNFFNHTEYSTEALSSMMNKLMSERTNEHLAAKVAMKEALSTPVLNTFRNVMSWYFISSYTEVDFNMPIWTPSHHYYFLGCILMKNMFIPAALQGYQMGYRLFNWFVLYYLKPISDRSGGRFQIMGVEIADALDALSVGPGGTYVGLHTIDQMTHQDIDIEPHFHADGVVLHGDASSLLALFQVCFAIPITNNIAANTGIHKVHQFSGNDTLVYQSVNSCVSKRGNDSYQIPEFQRIQQFIIWFTRFILTGMSSIIGRNDRNAIEQFLNALAPLKEKYYDTMYGMNVLVKQMGICPISTVNIHTNYVGAANSVALDIDGAGVITMQVNRIPNDTQRYAVTNYFEKKIKFVNAPSGIAMLERLDFRNKKVGTTHDQLRVWGSEIVEEVGYVFANVFKTWMITNARSPGWGTIPDNDHTSQFRNPALMTNVEIRQLFTETSSSDWSEFIKFFASKKCKHVSPEALAKVVVNKDGLGISRLLAYEATWVDPTVLPGAPIVGLTDIPLVDDYTHDLYRNAAFHVCGRHELFLYAKSLIILPSDLNYTHTLRRGLNMSMDGSTDFVDDIYLSTFNALADPTYDNGIYEGGAHVDINPDYMVNDNMTEPLIYVPSRGGMAAHPRGGALAAILAGIVAGLPRERQPVFTDSLRNAFVIRAVDGRVTMIERALVMPLEDFSNLTEFERIQLIKSLEKHKIFLRLDGWFPIQYKTLTAGEEYYQRDFGDLRYLSQNHYPIIEIPVYPYQNVPNYIDRPIVHIRYVPIVAPWLVLQDSLGSADGRLTGTPYYAAPGAAIDGTGTGGNIHADAASYSLLSQVTTMEPIFNHSNLISTTSTVAYAG